MKPPTGFSNEVPIGGFLCGMCGMSDVSTRLIIGHIDHIGHRLQFDILSLLGSALGQKHTE